MIQLIQFLVIIALSGCSIRMDRLQAETDPSTSEPGSLSSPSLTPAPVSQWTEKEFSVGNHRMKVSSLKEEFREEIKKQFKLPELKEIRSKFSGQFKLYRVSGIEGQENTVFVEPKIYVYGTAQGGNVLGVSSQNGNVMTLTIPMLFVDGTQSSIASYQGNTAVVLPDHLKIPDVDQLKEDLKEQLKADVKLLALPGCPHELSLIQVKGASHDRYQLKPTTPISKSCRVNEFFTVSLTSSRKRVTDIIQNALNDGLGVQVVAKYQIQYNQPIALYSLVFSPKDMREKVKSSLALTEEDSEFILGQDLVLGLQRVLASEVDTMGVNSVWVPFSRGVQLLSDAYFQEATGERCQAPDRCYRLKSVAETDFDQILELMWIEQESLGATGAISTVAFIQGLAESYPIAISNASSLPMLSMVPTQQACNEANGNLPNCPGFSCDRFPENVYCRNGGSKTAVHQFQVFPGAKLKFNFDKITDWGFELKIPREDTPEEKKRGTLTCADTKTVIDTCLEYEESCPVDLVDWCPKPVLECDQKEKLYDDHCVEKVEKERDCGSWLKFGLGDCDLVVSKKTKDCNKVEIGEKCVHFKESCNADLEKVCPQTKTRTCRKFKEVCNQYTQEFYQKYTYSEPWVRPRVLNVAEGATIAQLWDGLDLEFSWLAQDGKTFESVTFPLKAFPHYLNGYSAMVTLENQEGTSCQPFNDWNTRDGHWPEIAIINHIQTEKTYICGFLEWSHSIVADQVATRKTEDRLEYTCPETGQKSSTPIVRSYHPIVDLGGSVSILGRSMDTVSSRNEATH